MIPLVNKPMHARFSFHHSSLQLSFITQAWTFKLKLVLWKQTYEMHIQMHHTSLWACSPYLCASLVHEFWSISYLQCCSLYLCAQNFNWSLSFVKFSLITYLFISCPFCCLCTLFSPHVLISLFFSPFVINDHKSSKCR